MSLTCTGKIDFKANEFIHILLYFPKKYFDSYISFSLSFSMFCISEYLVIIFIMMYHNLGPPLLNQHRWQKSSPCWSGHQSNGISDINQVSIVKILNIFMLESYEANELYWCHLFYVYFVGTTLIWCGDHWRRVKYCRNIPIR